MRFEESGSLMTFLNRLQQRYRFPIVRIDDRLIHGQVILGWVEPLKIRSLILAHDIYANDKDLVDAITATIPPYVDFWVLPMSNAVASIRNRPKNVRLMVVVDSPDALKFLLDNGCDFSNVTIGGLHHQEDRIELLPYVYMTRAEMNLISKIVESGVDVRCQDLPGTSPVLWKSIKEKLDVR